MTILEILDNKILDLNDTLVQLRNSGLSEKQRLEAELVLLEECENVLTSEELIRNYDFTSTVELLQNQNLTIDNIEKVLLEVKQVIDVKKAINMPELPFSEIQISTLNQLRTNLAMAKEDLKTRINAVSEDEKNKSTIENLEELKNILAGTSKRKYYTDEMFEALSDVVDWQNISDEEFDSIIAGFYTTKNLQGRRNKEKEDIRNVIELYQQFLEPSEFTKNSIGKYTGIFAALIYAHEDEIATYIDLDNTREILDFFKEKGIISKFDRNALLKISLFADIEYVKFLYNKIMTEYPEQIDLYYEDIASTLWICDSSVVKRTPFRVTRKPSEGRGEQSLYSQCHTVTDEEFRANVEYLKANADMLNEKYEISDFLDGAALKLLTSSSWSFIKNLELLKLHNVCSDEYRVPISSLELGNLENKIHLAIELGLLNPPMDNYFRALEEDIITAKAFLNMTSHSRISNNSIRNYFQRNITIIGATDISEYGFLKYRLDTLGFVDFYNYFFSERKTGKRDKANIDEDMRINMPDKDKFITDKFITDFYNQYIDNFDEYSVAISDYDETTKLQAEDNASYFEPSILEEMLVKKLDAEYGVIDLLTQNGTMIEQRNEYVYRFGDTLISRYKVLHNLSILKQRYGFITEEMLLASIVRNSFLTEEAFDNIKKFLKERVNSL